MTAKKLPPERIAEYQQWKKTGSKYAMSTLEKELLNHIEALEAELADQKRLSTARIDEQSAELAEADELSDRLEKELAERCDDLCSLDVKRALLEKELAESKAECERLRTELGTFRRLSELGWDVAEVGALKAQLADRDTLLKNENENYRRCAEECERLRAQVTAVRALASELEDVHNPAHRDISRALGDDK